MHIRYIPPSEIEATIKIEESGEIIISPRFASAKASAMIGSIIVKGSKGRERRFTLSVSGSQGRVNAIEAKSVEAEFDKPTTVVAK